MNRAKGLFNGMGFPPANNICTEIHNSVLAYAGSILCMSSKSSLYHDTFSKYRYATLFLMSSVKVQNPAAWVDLYIL